MQYGLLGGASFDYEQALKMLEEASKSETQRNIANQQIAAQNRAAKGKLEATAASPLINLGAKAALPAAKRGTQDLAAKAAGLSLGDTPSATGAVETNTLAPGGAAAAPAATEGLSGAAVAQGGGAAAAGGGQAAAKAAGSAATTQAAEQASTQAATQAAAQEGGKVAAEEATKEGTQLAAEGASNLDAGPYGLIATGVDVAAHAAGLKGDAAKAVDVGSGAASGALAGATVGSAFPVIGTAIGAAAGSVVGAAASYFG